MNCRINLHIAVVATLLLAIQGGAQEPPQHASRVLVRPKHATLAGHGSEVSAAHAAIRARVHREYPDIGGLQVVELPADVDVATALEHYNRSGLFEYAEPDGEVQVEALPNDASFGSLWGLNNTGQTSGTRDADIDAPEAWAACTGTSQVLVAVIDTGIRFTHEDLAANMWKNPGETGTDASGRDKATNGIDDDGDGYVDDVYGINAITGSGNPNDDHHHGTHVAGTIGAVRNNAVGVAGVAKNVQLMACKFLDSTGSGLISDAIECIDYARRKGAAIMNNSWGGGGFSQSLHDAIVATRDAGMIFVAAAGNASNNNDASPSYPASYDVDNIVAVAATDANDMLAWFSSYGATSVELAAPGMSIYSCWNSSDTAYGTLDGTSMATPHVTGAFALLRSEFPTLTYSALINRLLGYVDPIPSLAGKCSTGGRLNVFKALKAASCAYLVSPTNASFAATGGIGALWVAPSGSNCAVVVTANVSWITVTYVRPNVRYDPVTGFVIGDGSWTVNYRVATNTASARTGTLTAAGQTVTVTQAAVFPAPTGLSPGSSYPDGSATVSTIPVTLTWNPVAGASQYVIHVYRWDTATSTWTWEGGYTSAVNNLTFAPSHDHTYYAWAVSASNGANLGDWASFVYFYLAAPCGFAISPGSASFTSSGGTGTLLVGAMPGCAWTSTSNAGWITITSGGNGDGTGALNYSVAANLSTSPRSGTISVAGLTLTITQAGVPCSFTITPTASSFGFKGGTGSIAVTTTGGCGWTVAKNASWITITSAASGTGNGTVTYSVASMARGSATRTGIVTVAGKSFTVTQTGGK